MQTFVLVSLYVTWALLIVLAYAVFALYRHFGQMYLSTPAGRADQGPEVGSALLSIARTDTVNRKVTLPGLRPGVIIFADTACDLCSNVRDSFDVLDAYADKLQPTVVFCAGLKQDVMAWAERAPAYIQVVWDDRMRAATHYRVSNLPFAIAVGLAGTVKAKSIINGGEGLAWAAQQALGIETVNDELPESNESSEVARV